MAKSGKPKDTFQTTSPFETGASNKSLAATSNEVNSLTPSKDWTGHFSPSFDAKHFSNPAGLPGVALVSRAGEKSKLPYKGGK
jgi:hypothetical protein